MLIAVSTFILLVLAYGILKRRQSSIHIPVMIAAFVMDVLLVLYIEWNRHAVETFVDKVQAPMGNGLLLFHIVVSLLTLGLYVVQIVTGLKLAKGNETRRPIHSLLAIAFAACRLTNYVTSFWIPTT